MSMAGLACGASPISKIITTVEAARKLVKHTFIHYNHFWKLRTHFKSERLPYFQLTSKGHHCAHSVMTSMSLNPRNGSAKAILCKGYKSVKDEREREREREGEIFCTETVTQHMGIGCEVCLGLEGKVGATNSRTLWE